MPGQSQAIVDVLFEGLQIADRCFTKAEVLCSVNIRVRPKPLVFLGFVKTRFRQRPPIKPGFRPIVGSKLVWLPATVLRVFQASYVNVGLGSFPDIGKFMLSTSRRENRSSVIPAGGSLASDTQGLVLILLSEQAHAKFHRVRMKRSGRSHFFGREFCLWPDKAAQGPPLKMVP